MLEDWRRVASSMFALQKAGETKHLLILVVFRSPWAGLRQRCWLPKPKRGEMWKVVVAVTNRGRKRVGAGAEGMCSQKKNSTSPEQQHTHGRQLTEGGSAELRGVNRLPTFESGNGLLSLLVW
jgi:hypothetical protein